MKKMQKILCMLLALAMLLSFAACAAKEAAPSTTDTPAADAADAKTETKAEDTPAEQPAAELPELTLMLQTSDESNGLLAAVDYVNAHAEEIGAKLILEKVPDGDQGEQVIQVRYAGGEDVPDILYFQPVSYTNSRLSVADNFVDLTANDYSYLYSDSYLRTPRLPARWQALQSPDCNRRRYVYVLQQGRAGRIRHHRSPHHMGRIPC